MVKLLSRNLKLYFRDKVSVFFSLLSVIIVIVLFVLFLGQLQVDNIIEVVGNSIEKDKTSYLVHSWILAGLLSITTVTNVLGGYGSMVADKDKRIIMAFKSSPLKPWVYPLSNIVSSFIIGVIISIITLLCYFGAIYGISGYILSFEQIMMSVSIIIFASFVNSVILGLICSFLKTNSAFSSISILIGTIVGFINGLYVPIGSLSEVVANILNFFPTLHIASIFRQILTSGSISEVFKGAPVESVTDYSTKYGILLQFDGQTISYFVSFLYIVVIAVVCLVLMIMNIKRKTEEI